MKKISKALLFIAVSAMAAVSCAKENIVAPSAEGVTVHFSTADLATKSHFGDKTEDGKYPTLWTAGQTVAIMYNGSNTTTPSKIDVTPSDDFKTASFSKEFEISSTVSLHNFYITSPGDAAIGFSNGAYNLQLPTTQTPLDGSCDEAAQITVASHISETFDTEISNLQFSHVTAYGRMSVVLPDDAGEVSSIALTAGKNIAGRWFYSFEDGSLKENTASATITLNTSKTSDIFFGCAPVDLTNSTLEVVVTAANGTYEKTIDFTSTTKALKFEAGKVSVFSVSDFTKKASDEVYTLVTDASTLKIGDKVIIAASGSNYAISTTQNNNNRAQTAITKNGNTIVNPSKDVQLFTLGRSNEFFTFFTEKGYLYAAGSKKSGNYLRSQETLTDAGKWSLSISDGVAAIVSNGTAKSSIMSYNDSNTPPIFSCYTKNYSTLAIYTDGKGTGSLPTPPSIVLSTTEVSLAYDDEDVHEDITATISGQNVEVSCAAYDDEEGTTDCTWLIAEYKDGKVTYNAEKNGTSSARTAYIIISASNADGTTTKVITVTQKTETSANEYSIESSSLGAASTSATKMDDFISYNNSAANNYTNPLRIYSGNTFTINSSNSNITKVEYICNSASYAKELSGSTFNVDSEAQCSVTYSSGTNVVVTITGISTKLSVRVSGQVRLNGLKVTYNK